MRLLHSTAAFAVLVPFLPLSTCLLASELRIEVTKAVECERKSHDGDVISVNYRGSLLYGGKEFDSSYKRNKPFSFKLGSGQVIEGWDKGLTNMCIGEARRLTIPPEMGYGEFGAGSIPPNAVLVFETELMGIKGVVATPPKGQTTPSPSPIPNTGAAGSPKDHKKEGKCELLGPFALLVQGALGLLAISSLVFKRWRETPRRPLKIWFFDASKQVFGSALLHLANLAMSMFSSGTFEVVAAVTPPVTSRMFARGEPERQPNPCSYYLLNLGIDTTIGIPILVILLRLLHRGALLTPLANPPESIQSGNYGQPPRATWWLKQSIIYFIGLFGMKLCVLLIFQLLPWIAWVGDWALRWTEGNAAVQITFVMFIFPLIMNGLQYYIIDSFIKDRSGGGSGDHQPLPTDDHSDSDSDNEDERETRRFRRRSGGRAESFDDSSDEHHPPTRLRSTSRPNSTLKEANPTPVPARYDSNDAGSSSSGGSNGGGARVTSKGRAKE